MAASARRPTVKEVAQLAGVSPMTVSRTLSGGVNVKPEVQARVLAAVEKLGYHRNENARSIRPGQSSGLIGVAITNIANPYYSTFALGVEEEAARSGRRILLGNTAEDAAREERVKMTRLRQTIARRLKEAQNTAAMLTTFNEVDMSAAMAMRAESSEGPSRPVSEARSHAAVSRSTSAFHSSEGIGHAPNLSSAPRPAETGGGRGGRSVSGPTVSRIGMKTSKLLSGVVLGGAT